MIADFQFQQPIKACSVCWGSGRTIDGKPCLCGCMPNIVTSKPEDYGLPSYQQLREQIATLTRQRDLAVDAITRAIDMVGHPDNITYLQQTLDAIKESEAMAQGEKK